MQFQEICFPSAFLALTSANERCKIDCNVPILGEGGGGQDILFYSNCNLACLFSILQYKPKHCGISPDHSPFSLQDNDSFPDKE